MILTLDLLTLNVGMHFFTETRHFDVYIKITFAVMKLVNFILKQCIFIHSLQKQCILIQKRTLESQIQLESKT